MNTNKKTGIVARFPNTDEGTEAFVTVGNCGFHVSLKDTDSGSFLPFGMAFPTEERAIEYAKKIACVA